MLECVHPATDIQPSGALARRHSEPHRGAERCAIQMGAVAAFDGVIVCERHSNG